MICSTSTKSQSLKSPVAAVAALAPGVDIAKRNEPPRSSHANSLAASQHAAPARVARARSMPHASSLNKTPPAASSLPSQSAGAPASADQRVDTALPEAKRASGTPPSTCCPSAAASSRTSCAEPAAARCSAPHGSSSCTPPVSDSSCSHCDTASDANSANAASSAVCGSAAMAAPPRQLRASNPRDWRAIHAALLRCASACVKHAGRGAAHRPQQAQRRPVNRCAGGRRVAPQHAPAAARQLARRRACKRAAAEHGDVERAAAASQGGQHVAGGAARGAPERVARAATRHVAQRRARASCVRGRRRRPRRRSCEGRVVQRSHRGSAAAAQASVLRQSGG